jgi:hypothetical protein
MEINDENIRDYVRIYLENRDGSIKNWDVSNVTNMEGFFSNTDFNEPLTCETPNVTTMSNMFSNCPNFNSTITFNAPKLKDMSSMFMNCTSLNSLITIVLEEEFVFGNKDLVINMNQMFKNCTNYNQVFQFEMKNVVSLSEMFCNCTSFNNGGQLLFLYTYSVYDMSSAFSGCTSLNVEIHFFAFVNTNKQDMFYGTNLSEDPYMHNGPLVDRIPRNV